MSGLTILIPCYNEEKALVIFMPELLEFCRAQGYQLIFINDGSKDNTKKVITEAIKGHEFARLVDLKVNRGYGGAIKAGVLAANTEYVITIDGDGQHQLADVSNLYAKIQSEEADMIIGSREGQASGSFFRAVGKTLIRSFTKLIMHLPIYDLNSGMKIYRRSLAKKYLNFCSDGMPFSDSIALMFINEKHYVLEVPITIKERLAGESTINIKTAFDTVLQIIYIYIFYYPLKIFVTSGILVLVVSLLWGIPIMLQGRGVSVGTLTGILISFTMFLLGLIAQQIVMVRKDLMAFKSEGKD